MERSFSFPSKTIFMNQKSQYCQSVPKSTYKFSTTPIQSSVSLFIELDKTNLKIIWNFKGCRIAKIVLEENKVRGFPLLDLKI